MKLIKILTAPGFNIRTAEGPNNTAYETRTIKGKCICFNMDITWNMGYFGS